MCCLLVLNESPTIEILRKETQILKQTSDFSGHCLLLTVNKHNEQASFWSVQNSQAGVSTAAIYMKILKQNM